MTEDTWEREYQRWLRYRATVNRYRRARYANDPEYRERVKAYQREYRRRQLKESA